MTDKRTLLNLAERVETGEGFYKTFVGFEYHNAVRKVLCPLLDIPASKHNCAMIGKSIRSLDAAEALHNAVLPGWEWRIGRGYKEHPELSSAVVSREHSMHFHGEASSAPAAWVAAILRAKANQ